ncbi:MAG: hypothetical protein ABI369_01030 [Acetobacteraceae bacterium]
MKAVCPTLLMAALASTAAHADPQGLSGFVPVQVQDALAVHLGDIEFQGAGRFDKDTHNSRGSNLWTLSPEVKLGGPIKGLEFVVGTSYGLGDQSGANQGAGTIAAFYQINDNTKYVPAFAVEAEYATPYGPGHTTAEYTFQAIATKYLGTSDKAPRLDVNVFWTHRPQPGLGTRSDQLEIGAAYSMLIRDDTALVVDYVHGAKPAARQVENIVDVGFRHEISKTLAVSIGAGAGIAQQSPAYRVLFSIQKTFSLF